jgi:hypothetical protein
MALPKAGKPLKSIAALPDPTSIFGWKPIKTYSIPQNLVPYIGNPKVDSG